MTNIQDRISEIIEKLGINQVIFASKLGVKRITITAICTKRQLPSLELCAKIVLNYNISAEWLITGEGTMFKESGEKELKENIDDSTSIVEDETGIKKRLDILEKNLTESIQKIVERIELKK